MSSGITHDPKVVMKKPEGSIQSEQIAGETWKKGFIHLTVDGAGLVSLWDHELINKETGIPIDSYLKLPLTQTQQEMIQATKEKGGYTP